MTEMGEYLVGAYLKIVEKCEYVDYNVHPPGGGLKGACVGQDDTCDEGRYPEMLESLVRQFRPASCVWH